MIRSLRIFTLCLMLVISQNKVYSAPFNPLFLKNRKVGNGTGTQQLVRTLGGTGADVAKAIAVDTGGNFYVAGTYVNTTANASAVTDFSGAALNGKTATSSADVFVAKLNSSGTQQWIKTLGGTGADGLNSVAVDNSGNVYVSGNYFNSSANANSVTDFNGANLNGNTATASNDVFVAKINSSGTQQWIKTLGGTASDISLGIKADHTGNVYVVGSYRNTDVNANAVTDFNGVTLNGKTSASQPDAYVAKLDPTGSQLWIKTIGGLTTDNATAVAIDLSGNVYVTGNYGNSPSNGATVTDFNGATLLGRSSSFLHDVYVAKLNSSGNQQWIKTMGGEDIEIGYGVAADENGNVYVGGYYNNDTSSTNVVNDFSGTALLGKSASLGYDAFIAKLNSSGTQQWIKTMGGGGADRVTGVAVDGVGNVFVSAEFSNSSATDFSGAAFSSGGGLDAFVAKLDPSGTQKWIKALGGTGADSNAGVAVDNDGFTYVSGHYTNTTANASAVTDFSASALNGKTTTSSTDAWVVKMY